jgi:hypothetical protein
VGYFDVQGIMSLACVCELGFDNMVRRGWRGFSEKLAGLRR